MAFRRVDSDSADKAEEALNSWNVSNRGVSPRRSAPIRAGRLLAPRERRRVTRDGRIRWQNEGLAVGVTASNRVRKGALVLLASATIMLDGGCGQGSGGSSGPVNSVMGFEEALSIRRSLPNLAVTLFADDSISFREAVREANTIGCGVEIQLSGDIVSNATFEAHCADPNALGIRVIGPAQIEGELRSRCTGPSCAWVSFENLLVENAAGDGFDCALDGKMVVLDSEANVTGPFNNALTGHGACRFVAIGVEGSSSGPDAAPTIALVDDSQGTLLGDGVFVSSSATRDSVVHLGGHSGGEVRLSIIGPVLTCRAADQFAIVFRPGFGGVTELVSSMLVANCPIDLRVQTAQTAVWASHRDSIPGIVDSPSTGDSEVTIDDSRGKRTLELPVALPDWLTGEGEVTHISIPRI